MYQSPHRPARTAVAATTALWLAAALLVASAPSRADGMRCGSRLIVTGATRGEVLARCGEPTDVERRSILRRAVYWRHGRPYYLSRDLVGVTVETWTYNLGPNKLMRRLRLDDGIVVEIDTLGYGYHARTPAPTDRAR
jgi:hypothetical protein